MSEPPAVILPGARREKCAASGFLRTMACCRVPAQPPLPPSVSSTHPHLFSRTQAADGNGACQPATVVEVLLGERSSKLLDRPSLLLATAPADCSLNTAAAAAFPA